MSDGAATPVDKGEDLKARLKAVAEDIKVELGKVVDQKLDELGAKIGST